MSRAARSLLIAVAGLAALIIVSVIAFVLWSRANSQTIIGSVTVAEQDLTGWDRTAAEEFLTELESQQAEATIQIFVNEQSMTVTAAEFGYRINKQELLDLALWQERDGGFVTRWRRWLRGFFDDPVPVEFQPQSSIDQTTVENLLAQLDRQFGIAPIEGNVEFINGQPVATYPSPGWLLDSSNGSERIAGAALGGGGTVQLNTVFVAPRTEIGQIADALAMAHTWISAPVVIHDPAGEADLTFTSQEIADATLLQFDASATPPVTLNVDRRLVTRKLAEISDQVGDPPVDAYYEIDENDQVIIHPSRVGTVLDVAAIGDMLEQLAAGEVRDGTLPFVEGVQPQVTTEDIEDLGIRHLVSSYTTYHPCCAARVTNIQLFADKVNDALVPPGEEFSLNSHVGRRTVADGFVEAGTLVRGELVDTIGGGVSQFATTFYNAVFWGGYKDITHKTHSFYFPRYPEGIEATINWPEVDLVFLNDSSNHVLIRTEYTSTSITVKFFSDNGGRSIVGSWRDGRGRLEVVSEGGPNARLVSARVSGRSNQLEPPETLYRPNPELALDEVDQLQTAEEGWTVRVTRTIQHGEEITEHIRNVRYIPRQEIIEVHPCVMSLLTESGAVAPAEDPEAGQQESSASEEPVVCPGPEDEEPTSLPEGLFEQFPDLVPEETEQAPIEEEGQQAPIGEDEGEQAPIGEDDGEQAPTGGEEQPTPDPEEDTGSDDSGQ
ncbi:MAG: VanW family protein [bacterium]|nr:VanW family protein [Acidimicrobiia bacterium]MCY4648815.1 VanW family protein [bacterium]